jgi:hypothetical protein
MKLAESDKLRVRNKLRLGQGQEIRGRSARSKADERL